jgi:hypothetical protein
MSTEYEWEPCDECSSRVECSVLGCKKASPIDLSTPLATYRATAPAAGELQQALAALTPEHDWHWDADPVKGDPLGRSRCRVCTQGRTITQTYYTDEIASKEAALICAAVNAARRNLPAPAAEPIGWIDPQVVRDLQAGCQVPTTITPCDYGGDVAVYLQTSATAQDHRSSPPEHSDIISPKAVPGVSQAEPLQAEQMARRFHETYERLAPQFGYTTRTDTREFDPESPNGKLMIAVCAALQAELPAVPLTDAEILDEFIRLQTADTEWAMTFDLHDFTAGVRFAESRCGISASAQAGEGAAT